MTQLLDEALAESARAAVNAGDWKRDQEAWNLPRGPAAPGAHNPQRPELDWRAFSAANYPGSRRHNLEAIVAYGIYRSSGVVDDQPVEPWEDEQGASK